MALTEHEAQTSYPVSADLEVRSSLEKGQLQGFAILQIATKVPYLQWFAGTKCNCKRLANGRFRHDAQTSYPVSADWKSKAALEGQLQVFAILQIEGKVSYLQWFAGTKCNCKRLANGRFRHDAQTSYPVSAD